MARKTRAKPYSEKDAKAEVLAALEDLERGAVRLRETQKKLKGLASYKRVDAASKKGDDEATSLAWELAGGCEVTAAQLEDEEFPSLRRDLKRTDASCAAAAKKRAARLKRALKTPPPPSEWGLSPAFAKVAQGLAVSLETLAPALRSNGLGDNRPAGDSAAACLESCAKGLHAMARTAPGAEGRSCAPRSRPAA